MAVRFNNYQPGAQLAAALDQADRQYQDKLALGWVPSERDAGQNIFGSFWDSFTSSAESTLGGALTAAGVVADSPWLSGIGGDLTRQAAKYSDWANDYDTNPDKSRWSLGYFLDPHGVFSDAGVMLGSSAPGMLAGAALAAGSGGALPALAILGSAGLEVGANFGQGYMDAKRDNMEEQIKAGQRPTGTVYDGNIDREAWDNLTSDPYKNAELIGSSFMDTALDVATGATGGLFSLAGKGLAKAGIANALASNGGKVAGAVMGDAARADTLLGRAAYGLSTAGKPIDFIGNRVANAFGEGFQEAWQQRVQDAMANKFDDNRADAGSFFRDIANGDWNNFTDDEINSFNSAFLPTLVSGVGVAGARNAGRYMYNNIDSLGPTVEAKRDYSDLMQTTGIANALADSTGLSDYIGHYITPEALTPDQEAVAGNSISLAGYLVNPEYTSGSEQQAEDAMQFLPKDPKALEPPQQFKVISPTQNMDAYKDMNIDTRTTPLEDPMSAVIDSTRAKMADLPDILTRAYNNANIDEINKNIPEGDAKLSPELLNKAVQGDTNAAYYILSNLDRKSVVHAIRERNNEKKAQAKQAKQELDTTKNDIKNVIKGVGKKEDNTEAVQKAQDIIHSLAPNGKAEELADKTKSRFLKVNQALLDKANNGDTKAMRDVLRAIDPNAYMEVKNKQEEAQKQQPATDVADAPTEEIVAPEAQPQVKESQEQTKVQPEQQTQIEQKPVETKEEAVPQQKVQQTPAQAEKPNVSPLGGIVKPQETQTVPAQVEQTTPQTQEQPAQNAQNAANQGYSMDESNVTDNKGVVTPPKPEGVNKPKNVVNNTQQQPVQSNHPNSKANVIANANTTEGLHRARNILAKFRKGKHVKVDKDTAAKIASKDENVSRPVITQLLQDIDDDTYNRVMKIPKGDKNENIKTSESTEGGTDNPTETRAETGGNTHQQGRLDGNGTSTEAPSPEASPEQTDKKEVTPSQVHGKPKDEEGEHESSKTRDKEVADNLSYHESGDPDKKDNDETVDEDEEDDESGFADIQSSYNRFSDIIHNRNDNEEKEETEDDEDLTDKLVIQESTDEKANRHYNKYREGKLRKIMTSFVGSSYGSMNRMSFANLVTMLPNARLYLSFIGGAHKFATPEEEFRAKMHYTAIFGSLASFGINLLRNRMTVATGADSMGIMDYENPESFRNAYADLLDILPGAIHTAIATYDGIRVKTERDEKGNFQNVASLNTWFYYILNEKYQQYLVDRGGDSLILAKFKSKQIYSAAGDLLPGKGAKTREEKIAAARVVQGLAQLQAPKELDEYGIKTFSDITQWLFTYDYKHANASRTTGRMKIALAVNNEMVRGRYAERLRKLLGEAKKTGDYSEYAHVFMQAFKSAFLSVVNTEEGNAAWNMYQIMRHLDSATQRVLLEEMKKVPTEIRKKANEYGKTFIMNMAFETQTNGIGKKERIRDVEVEKYVHDTIAKIEKEVSTNKSLTKEGKAVAITKVKILLEALTLAEAAKDKYLKPNSEAAEERAEKERAAKLKYKQAQRKKLEDDDDHSYGDKSHNQTGGEADNESKSTVSVKYDYNEHVNLDLERSRDYHAAAIAARYLSIISFEIQLCTEFDNNYYKEMLKEKNQDRAYMSSTEKANLMIAFIVRTVLDNYGDLGESEFAQHKGSSDADNVREYAKTLIERINGIFPTAKTKRKDQEHRYVSMKDFDDNLEKICQDIQKEGSLGRKLFGLSRSKGIISKMHVDGKEVNRLVDRRTTKFPWLNTKTTANIMPADIFDKSKFVAQFLKDGELNFDEISISDMLPIVTENGKRRQVNPNKYKQIMSVLGYKDDTIKELSQFDDKWIEDLWGECSKDFSKKVESKEKYNERKDDFINRWKNAINYSRRAVIAVGMAGTGHFFPNDSSVALRLGFAIDRGITEVDAILLSKALEAKIKYVAKKMEKEQNAYAERAVHDYKVTRDNARVYKYKLGQKQGTFAAEMKDEHVVSYKKSKYLLTDDEYEKYKNNPSELGKLCQPDNMVVVSPRDAAGVSAAEGKEEEEPYIINNRGTRYYMNTLKDNGHGGVYLQSSNTVVGAVDTLTYEYFRKDSSGLSNNVIVKALMVLDAGLPKEVILNNGIDAYIEQVAKAKQKEPAAIREQIVKKIGAAVNKFISLEQSERAAVTRDSERNKFYGTPYNVYGDKKNKIAESSTELLDDINNISLHVRYLNGKFDVYTPMPKFNYSDAEIKESEYIDSWAYTDLRKAILGALVLMDNQDGNYKVKPLIITKNSPINKIKGGIVNIHDTDSTKWTAKEKVDISENPIASLLQYLGSVDKSDLKEEYGKDITFTFEDLMASPKYNYLMMAHNDSMMGSDGLITSLHTFSYKLAQKDELTYTDIANLCALVTIASQRLKGLDSTNKFAKALEGALSGVDSSPERYESNQKHNRNLVRLSGVSKSSYGRQLNKLQPLNRYAINDLYSEIEDIKKADIIKMNKENVAFLGTDFKESLNGDVGNRIAHILFVNEASKVLGVAPYVSGMLEGNNRYKESTGRIEAQPYRSTVYHELMHAFTDEAITVDLAQGKYKLATKADKDREYKSFGDLTVDRNAKDVPRTMRGEAEAVIGKAIRKELTKSIEILKNNDSLLAKQILAITELVDVNKLVEFTAHLWAYSNLVGFDETKAGDARFISKVGATTLGMFYSSSDRTDYEDLVMNMILPSVIYGAKVVSGEMPLFYQTKKIITETYSHLNSVPTSEENIGNIAGSDSSDFMTTWLYQSTELLRALQVRDPDSKIRNIDKIRMRNELLTAAKKSIRELTMMDEKTDSDSKTKDEEELVDKLETKKNQHAEIRKKKQDKKKNIGTSKGAITPARDVSHDAGSPHGWFMKLLYAIANMRNKTFSQTSSGEVNHAKDIKLAWMPGMRWLEELVSKEDSDRLFDKSQRCIARQQELNALSDAYVKQLQQLLTIKGNELQTKALKQYFETEINNNSDRGRDLVELFNLPYEAGQDERCKNRSSSGRNAMIKVYADDIFLVLHNEPDKATAMAKMNEKIKAMKAYNAKKGKPFYKNQAFWYREDTGTLVFYACKDERMQNGKFKNLFIAYPSNEDGTGAKGRARMEARLQKQVLKECEQYRRKRMKEAGYAQPVIDGFIASQALYRALLMNAYSREQKRALQNDDIINRTKTGFLHAYAPRYYARYILQKEVWHEVDEAQAKKYKKSQDEGFIVQRGDKYYNVITYSIGSFESKRDRAKYRNEHPIGKDERYVEKTRDEWLQEQGGGRTDIVGNVDTAIGTLTNKDVERGKKEAETDIAGRLAKFIGKKFNDSEKWQGEDSINQIVDALRNMNEDEEKEFGKYKPRLIRTAKMIHVDKNNVQSFQQVRRALQANGAQYLAANYARERTSSSGLYSHDVIGSLKHYLHTVNGVEALTPFYRDMTQTIYKYTGKNYDRTKRDSYYSAYNIMCELVDNMNGRDKPVDGFMRRLSVMVVDAIYAVPGMRSILNACGVYLPDMWLPALLHNSIAVNVYLKLGMFNVSTALAQYAQLANVYALGGEEAFAYAMKKMPGILAQAHKPSDILKNEFDVSKYGKEIQQVMADLYLTKQGKSLLEQEGEKAFSEALDRGDKTAIELQVFDEMFATLKGKDGELVMNDVATQLGNAGSAYEGESIIDKMPKTGKKILDLSMGGFRGADLACRLFAALTAQHIIDTSPKYKKFRESKAELGEEEYNAQRMLMIRDFVYRTNFNFNRATDPLLLAKGGLLAKCVFQFASYGFQTFHFMYWMIKNKKSTELKRFLGTMMLFSGVISGIPMMTMISGMAQAITGTNPEDWIKAFIMKAAGKRQDSVSHEIAEALCYGIAAPVFGVDISKKVGLADIMKDPTDVRNLGGPSLGTAIDFSSAVGASYDAILYDKYTTDQLMFAWLKAVPAASRWLQAARGQYYSYSKLMPKSEYQSMSNADRAKNFMGFNPIDNKLNTDINRYITDENQEYSNKAKDAMIAYVNNPTDANLKKLQSYGKTPEQAHKAVDKYIKPKITAEQAEKMVTKAKAPEAELVRSNVRALSGLLN
nr:MAG TPA: PLxRFG domain protein [Caudoviricetes sp.]